MKVRCGEGIANHTGPESCAGTREGVGEALTGECTGQPLSREMRKFRVPTRSKIAEGKTMGHVNASASSARRGRRPWHVRTLPVREPGDLQLDHSLPHGVVRIGKARSRSR